MNIFRRCAAAFTTQFDCLVSQIENHEALIGAAVREMQASGAKAKVQLERVRRDGRKMKQRIEELAELDAVWKERAIRVHKEDKDRALECLRRGKAVSRELSSLRGQLEEHSRLEEQLAADMKVIDQRISEMQRRKNTFSARQYRAEALATGEPGGVEILRDIDEIFERWEMKIGHYELSLSDMDSFESEFEEQETRDSLTAELDNLISNTNQ